MTRNVLIGLLGLGFLIAAPATAKADFGFSFRYGGGYCGPVVVRSYPRYYARPYYGGRYYGRTARVYR